MAIQFSAVTDLVYRLAASGLPASYPLTWAGFVRVDADSNDLGPVVVRYADAAGTIRQQVLLNSTGATNLLDGEAQTSGGTTAGFVATIGVWYPFTLVVTQNVPNVQTDFYVNNVLIGSIASADIADTSASMAMGSTGANLPKLSLAGVRLWTAALTSPERAAEAASLLPVKASPWASYQFTSSGTLLTDSSGNGRSLTVSGAPTFTADPVLVVATGQRARPLFAAGGPFGAGPFGELVQPTATNVFSPDAWDWDAEDYAELDSTMEIVESAQVLQPPPAVSAQPVEDFVAEADYEDPIADLVEASTGPVQANAPPADQPAEDAWSWLNDPDDSSDPWWPDDFPLPTETPVADQSTQDAWPWDDDTPDDAPADEPPVGPNEPAIAVDDAWAWDETIDEADAQFGTDAVGDNQPAIAVDEPGDDAAVDADDWWHDGAAPVPETVLVADQPPQPEPDFAEDVGDEYCDDSAPVGADAPVVLLEQPPADAWGWDTDAADDLVADDFLSDNEPAIAVADGWDWNDDEQDDTLLLIDAVLAADEPPLPVLDVWNWDEEPADDDAWWQQAEHVLVDFVQLAGPTYAEDWDWNGEDTVDDDWWAEIPQPDAGALPPDTCPAQLAAAMARIAELEAQLAAALANAGGGMGGGGGDNDYRRPDDNWREEERARIERNNALIMALAGAVVHGIRQPKD